MRYGVRSWRSRKRLAAAAASRRLAAAAASLARLAAAAAVLDIPRDLVCRDAFLCAFPPYTLGTPREVFQNQLR